MGRRGSVRRSTWKLGCLLGCGRGRKLTAPSAPSSPSRALIVNRGGRDRDRSARPRPLFGRPFADAHFEIVAVHIPTVHPVDGELGGALAREFRKMIVRWGR